MIYQVILNGRVADGRDVPAVADLEIEATSVNDVIKQLASSDQTPTELQVKNYSIEVTGMVISEKQDESESCELCEGSEETDCDNCEGLGEIADEEGEAEECSKCEGMGTTPCPECQ